METERFEDYYECLQVSPNADFETIQRVFRLLARRYHPDNSSGSADRFNQVVEAYRVLSDPEKRAAYDATYSRSHLLKWRSYVENSTADGVDADRRMQQAILTILYRARRHDALNPGVGAIYLENMLGSSEEQMRFHLWYMQGKDWLARTDDGKLAITVAGVDALQNQWAEAGREMNRPLLEAFSKSGVNPQDFPGNQQARTA